MVAGMCVLAFYPVARGRTLWLPGPDLDSKPRGVIRILSCNISPVNDNWQEAFGELMRLDADVVVLIEVPPPSTYKIDRHSWVGSEMYPYWQRRGWVRQKVSPCFVLSKWPMERLVEEGDPRSTPNILHMRIDHPDGAFVAGMMHPLSPRDSRRWAEGNAIIVAQGEEARRTHHETGLAVILGADLNAGPAQVRARTLGSLGLHKSKPLLRVGGSYPADRGVPAALELQLDDIWTLGAVRAQSWSSVEVLGSDHRAVVADFVIGE